MQQAFHKEREQILDFLDINLPPVDAQPKILHEAMRYAVLNGGKKLRPVLAIAACEAVGGKYEHALQAACAVELIHSYSLIHDDLPCMDNDDLRRGKPTCHKKFGEAIALLTGDALLTLSFEWLAKSKIKNPARKAELISALAEAAGHFGMIGGQTVDIEETGCSPGEEKLLFIHHHKTADLIKASVVIGGISGNADERQIKKLSNFGFNIGMAFQFIDDILDYTQTSDTMGKTAGKDQAAGKVTAVSVFGLEETTSRAEKYKTQALKILKETDFEKSVLADISCFITKRVF